MCLTGVSALGVGEDVAVCWRRDAITALTLNCPIFVPLSGFAGARSRLR